MSLIPGLPKGFDLSATIAEFLTLLKAIDTKLGKLLELEEQKR